jgi:hypothetical protein
MLTLLVLSGCLIDREAYERRRAELLAEEEDETASLDDTACTPLTVWVDADGDGWGNSAYPDTRCGDLTGWATVDGDCDDGAAAVHPAADERCDTPADDDCDGATNEPGAVDGVPLHGDLDGDGFGDAAVTEAVCAAGDGWVDDATDCDDTDAGVNPGAEEVCNTGVDEDCDAGTACRLAGEVSVEGADVTWVGPDGVGVPVAVGDLTGDGLDDVALLGTTDLFLASDPADGTGAASSIVINDLLPELRLFHATGGDFDGDGVRDVAVTAMDLDVVGDSAIFLFDGPFDAPQATSRARTTIEGDGTLVLGFSVATANDLNGDGLDELVYSELSLTGTSSVYVHQPDAGVANPDQAFARFSGGEVLGYAVATGDANDDGLEDIVVAVPGADEQRGAVYVFLGPVDGRIDAEPDTGIYGAAPGAIMGVSLVFQPFVDADGDGDADLIVGAWGTSDIATGAGAAYLFTGPLGSHLDPEDAVGTYAGAHADAGMGYGVSGAGDVDGDGRGDLLIGANPSTSGDSTGRTYLMYGPATGTYLENELDVTFEPAAGSRATRLGYWPGAPGDVDGDGFADVLLCDPSVEDSAGAAYLFRGSGR